MRCSAETLDWLAVLSATGVRPARWVRLLDRYEPAELVLMLRDGRGRERLGAILGVRVGRPDEHFVESQLEAVSGAGCGITSIGDPDYPRILRTIHDPPPVLFYRGNAGVLGRAAVCIVGSRGASRAGLVTASRLAASLSRRGYVVVSGLARGIDSAAHTGALEGPGGTCAVLGSGIDVIYPRENTRLAARIAAHGCIVTEFPAGAQPLKYHFPLRNRILSGLSLGTVVVEAGLGSGAMRTAEWAVQQDREVFAVPGPVDREGSRGPHRLIREGARLVETCEDILAELPPHGIPAGARSEGSGPAHVQALREEERWLLSALELEPKHIDEITEICHIPATSALALLLELEIRGLVSSCGGGRFALAAPGGV